MVDRGERKGKGSPFLCADGLKVIIFILDLCGNVNFGVFQSLGFLAFFIAHILESTLLIQWRVNGIMRADE